MSVLSARSLGSLEPSSISFVEAHGSGTALGDPIEVSAICAALSKASATARPPVVVGTAKSCIGHLEGAAGLAGLLKAQLSAAHRTAAPNAQLRQPNPLLLPELAARTLELPTLPTPLKPAQSPGALLGGVSAFGFGGSNAHVVVRAAPAPPAAALARVRKPLRRSLQAYDAQKHTWRDLKRGAPPSAGALAARLAALTAGDADGEPHSRGNVLRSDSRDSSTGDVPAADADAAAAPIDALVRAVLPSISDGPIDEHEDLIGLGLDSLSALELAVRSE